MATKNSAKSDSQRTGSVWNGQRKGFIIAVTSSFLLLQLLFLVDLCYLYGSLYKSNSRTHALNILAVDYDGGIIGQSMLGAYDFLRGPIFPTLEVHTTAQYPSVNSIRTAVCHGDYWAAIYALPGASTRLSAALQGGDAARAYNSSETIQYLWNEARYTTTAESLIKANMETLIAASRVVYSHINGTRALQSMNTSDETAVNILMNPIVASNINIKPTTHGTRVLYNTVSVALSIVQQFFFVMAINGVSSELNLFSKLPPRTNGLIRMGLATVYTFVGSLCWMGYVWAFKEGWEVNGAQFVLSWMAGWLFMYINFLVLDIGAVFIPMHFMPFFVLTWIITNVTSSLGLFETSPGFYRWGYALPAHAVYQVFVQIWSGGCNNQLYRALPILLAWLLATQVGIILATNRRCRIARAVEQMEKEAAFAAETRNDDKKSPETSIASSDSTKDAIGPDALIRAHTAPPKVEPPEIPLQDWAYSPSMPVAFQGNADRVAVGTPKSKSQ
ncbi:hypothetical protein H2201_004237 [Coniosporium apollinis]|uniref:DUF3533 domain-containing protein n=2 Tax=Coniosporium TaxID=2810619 RepID=A0ABQ9NV70_9PEZI|nr:hypothetical protein H2199_000003 [Cladosporium sp. JES 115]KAJ9665546.1 hypothetical protein H2201_004237 [Coniosporium apollinis]